MNRLPISLSFLLIAVLPLAAQDYTGYSPDTTKRTSEVAHDTTRAIDPATLEQGAWIGINGTVGMVGPNSFFLDHGDSTVIVGLTGEILREYDFIRGQKVTVYGKIDQDLFQKNVIKARAVVIEGSEGAEHTVIGEEDKVKVITASYVPTSVIHGMVTAVTEKRIVIDQGENKISIDTSELSFDPKDEQGRVQVKQGDLVTVQGVVERGLWDTRTMKATSLDVIDLDGLSTDEEQKAGTDQYPDERK